MEGFYVENIWDDVHIHPETSAYIGRLLEQVQSDTGSQKFTEVLGGELAKSLENILFDLLSILIWIVWAVCEDYRREIGAINRIVNGHCDLILGIVIDHRACDGGPHRG
jgi:hypothetical protein